MKKAILFIFLFTAIILNSQVLDKDFALSEIANETITFTQIDIAPIFSGCEGDKQTKRKCTQNKITNHVQEHFNVDLANSLNLKPGSKKIMVQFVIDNKGLVKNIRVSAPHRKLEKEVIRFIKLLPAFEPGEERGEKVAVTYSLPIRFKIEEKPVSSNINEIEEEEIDEIPEFSTIEKVPVYKGCNGNNKKLRKCMSSKIAKHISKNFNLDLAESLKLSAGKKRILVSFIIDKAGFITKVKAKGPHPVLEREAIRVVKLLPQMKASGKQRGKSVKVSYNLPIYFNVEENVPNLRDRMRKKRKNRHKK